MSRVSHGIDPGSATVRPVFVQGMSLLTVLHHI